MNWINTYHWHRPVVGEVLRILGMVPEGGFRVLGAPAVINPGPTYAERRIPNLLRRAVTDV